MDFSKLLTKLGGIMDDVLLTEGNSGTGISSTSGIGIPDPSRPCDNQDDELIVDWPQHETARRRVTFSKRSLVRVFAPQECSWYTVQDREIFREYAIKDALRIRSIVQSKPDFFNAMVLPEELVGIEHIVLHELAQKVLRERKDHARSVLIAYALLSQAGAPEAEDSTEVLSAISATLSAESARRARIRAAIAFSS
mmetsp:Transcript_19413/g.40958  ORF Transcript_19413/g.40958 Transcript_19413/m.40958 type:complete len:196 (-) Transcript_19413:180-767(-)